MATNKPGRPPLDRADTSVAVSLVIPGRTFDALYARAKMARLTVPEVIRRALRNSDHKKIETP